MGPMVMLVYGLGWKMDLFWVWILANFIATLRLGFWRIPLRGCGESRDEVRKVRRIARRSSEVRKVGRCGECHCGTAFGEFYDEWARWIEY